MENIPKRRKVRIPWDSVINRIYYRHSIHCWGGASTKF